MVIFLATIVLLVLVIYSYMHLPKFGRQPAGERLERIRKSPNFREGSFQNISHTPNLTEGVSYWKVFRQFFFQKNERSRPGTMIPSVKTDLHKLDPDQDVLVWFGHSSYYMQIGGKRMLVDPVLSGSASPLPGGTKAFPGTDIYSADDIPAIDFLFISHDHWDHLDYQTIKKLRPKINTVICGLGVGEHLELWGYAKTNIIERDWNEKIDLGNNFTVITTPARHFSGRTFKRNRSLWMSFVLVTPTLKIFIGGDSGYDSHFKKIGNTFGPFDLAILENGQYNDFWRYIHTLPDEFLKVAMELKAKRVFPVHNSKFVLGSHAWDEPLETVTKNNETIHLPLLTPRIGELVDLKRDDQIFSKWWKDVS